MPRAKGQHDMLEPGLRFFLANGRPADLNEDPRVPHGFGNGVFEAFQLWGRVLRHTYSHGSARPPMVKSPGSPRFCGRKLYPPGVIAAVTAARSYRTRL
jgi:hypothetical protein